MPDDTRKIMTVPEAGGELGLGKSAAYAAAKRGEIPTVRIGRRLLVPKDAVDHILRQAIRTAGMTPEVAAGE